MSRPELMKHYIEDKFLMLAKREKNINDVSIRMIADACGISRNTFYYHFENREQLIISIIDSGISATREARLANPRFKLIDQTVLPVDVSFFLYSEKDLCRKLFYDSFERETLRKHIRAILHEFVQSRLPIVLMSGVTPDDDGTASVNIVVEFVYLMVVDNVLLRVEAEFMTEDYASTFNNLITNLIKCVIESASVKS